MLGGTVADRPQPALAGDSLGARRHDSVPAWEGLHGSLLPAVPGAARTFHYATLVAALVTWAFVDRHLWFFGDEWDFLARRGLHGAYFSLWAPHNEHWSVLPILLWRGLYSAFHLTTYWPYLAPLLAAHLAVVHLVWRRSLISGAETWVATILAAILAFFGPGAEDLAWAFQIGFVGALALGMAAWEVAERAPMGVAELRHGRTWPSYRRGGGRMVRSGGTLPLGCTVQPGGPVQPGCTVQPGGTLRSGGAVRSGGPVPLGRRVPLGRYDLAAAALIMAALMCSTVGLATATGLAVLLLARSGWRHAVAVMAVPGAAYLVWFALSGRYGLAATGDRVQARVFWRAVPFLAWNFSDALGSTLGLDVAGPVFVAALAAWLWWRRRRLWPSRAGLWAALSAAVAFYLLAALARDRISVEMSPSRYTYIGAALFMPALALLISQYRPHAGHYFFQARAIVLCGLVVAGSVDLAQGISFVRGRTNFIAQLRDQIVTSAALLQLPAERRRAINYYPFRDSGDRAGYLSTPLAARLYRQHLLGHVDIGTLSNRSLEVDESWLDVSTSRRPLYTGRDRLAVAAGFSAGEVSRQPRGPGACTWARPLPTTSPRLGHSRGPEDRDDSAPSTGWLRLRAPSGQRSSTWVSLGPVGGRLYVSLADYWVPTRRFMPPQLHPWLHRGVWGEQVAVGAGSHVWVDTSVMGDGVVLRSDPLGPIEVCGLSTYPRRGSFVSRA